MSETALTTEVAELEFAALVALDWAEQKHDWKRRDTSSGALNRGVLKNTPEAVEAWAAELNLRFQGRPVAVCLEPKQGPLV